MKICFATNNQNKLKEIRSLVPDEIKILSLEEIGCNDELPETHETIAENSQEKAEYVFNKYKVACFADDSGLEVKALDGAPGVYSAMYAGPQRSHDDNIRKLLMSMATAEDRSAQFRSVITYVDDNKTEVFEGISSGYILKEKKGSKGFGYDPVFVPEGDVRTYAEMTMEEKNKTNHRARAFKKFVSFLNKKGSHD